MVKKSLKDKLLIAKLTFFESMATLAEPFLTEFQSNKPLAPFLYTSLLNLVKKLMARVVIKDVIDSTQIHQIDLKNKNNLLKAKDVDIGFATRSALGKCSGVTEKDVLVFRNDWNRNL